MQIFADNQFSYRDMPIRYFEPATVYRDEKTGQLSDAPPAFAPLPKTTATSSAA